MPLVVERSRRFAQTVGTPRAVVFLLVVVAAFIASTWKQLVQGLAIGLTGRERAAAALAELGLDPGTRAEALRPEQFAELAGLLA